MNDNERLIWQCERLKGGTGCYTIVSVLQARLHFSRSLNLTAALQPTVCVNQGKRTGPVSNMPLLRRHLLENLAL